MKLDNAKQTNEIRGTSFLLVTGLAYHGVGGNMLLRNMSNSAAIQGATAQKAILLIVRAARTLGSTELPFIGSLLCATFADSESSDYRKPKYIAPCPSSRVLSRYVYILKLVYTELKTSNHTSQEMSP
jgi:hypothetical protein